MSPEEEYFKLQQEAQQRPDPIDFMLVDRLDEDNDYYLTKFICGYDIEELGGEDLSFIPKLLAGVEVEQLRDDVPEKVNNMELFYGMRATDILEGERREMIIKLWGKYRFHMWDEPVENYFSGYNWGNLRLRKGEVASSGTGPVPIGRYKDKSFRGRQPISSRPKPLDLRVLKKVRPDPEDIQDLAQRIKASLIELHRHTGSVHHEYKPKRKRGDKPRGRDMYLDREQTKINPYVREQRRLKKKVVKPLIEKYIAFKKAQRERFESGEDWGEYRPEPPTYSVGSLYGDYPSFTKYGAKKIGVPGLIYPEVGGGVDDPSSPQHRYKYMEMLPQYNIDFEGLERFRMRTSVPDIYWKPIKKKKKKK